MSSLNFHILFCTSIYLVIYQARPVQFAQPVNPIDTEAAAQAEALYDDGEEEVEVAVEEDTEPEAQVQAEHDPDAWVLDEAWQPDEEVWSKWNHWEHTKAKWRRGCRQKKRGRR